MSHALDEILTVTLANVGNPVTALNETLRFATAGFVTSSADTPAKAHFKGVTVQAMDASRTMFAPRTTKGRSTINVGAIELLNGNGALDNFISYRLDGRVVTIQRGRLNDALGGNFATDFVTDFIGTLDGADVSQDYVRLKLRDRMAVVNVPLQTNKFTGAGVGTLEGTADTLKGKPKPVGYGKFENVPVPCVEAPKLIFQVNDGPVQSFDAVRDRGLALASGGTYASTTDLLDNGLAPSAGQYKTYSGAEGAYIRLGAQPDGLVTVDATQGATAADRYAGQVFEALLTRAGLSASDWTAADVTAIDTAAPYVLSYWTDSETTIATVLDLVANSVGAAWFPDLTGTFRLQQLVEPSGSPVITFTANDLKKPLLRIAPNDPGQGKPTYQCIVRYRKNYAVQETDIEGTVTQATREFLAHEWREASALDADVQTDHPLAIQSVDDSLLTVEADAQAEADRRQMLRGIQRHFFELVVNWDEHTAAVELNDVIELTHPRYHLNVVGSDDGALLCVLGLQPNAKDRTITMTCWGLTDSNSNWIDDDGAYVTDDDGAYVVLA